MNSHLPLTARLHDYEQCKAEQEDGSIDIVNTDSTHKECGKLDVVDGPGIAGPDSEAEVGVKESRHGDGSAGGMLNNENLVRGKMMRRETEVEMGGLEGKGEDSLGVGGEVVEAEASIRDTGDLDVACELNEKLEEKEKRETKGW